MRPPAEANSSEAEKWNACEIPEGYSLRVQEESRQIPVVRDGRTSQETQSESSVREWINQDEGKLIRMSPVLMGLSHYRDRGEKAWKGWDSLKSDTLAAWESFREVAPEKTQPLSRIGLKYINRFDLPGENLALDRYFRTLPDTSADLPGQGMSSFMLQLDLPQPDKDANVRLILVRVPPLSDQENVVSIILDIEAYYKVNSADPLADGFLSDTLATLHRLENDVFESTITKHTRQLMKPKDSSETVTS